MDIMFLIEIRNVFNIWLVKLDREEKCFGLVYKQIFNSIQHFRMFCLWSFTLGMEFEFVIWKFKYEVVISYF